MKVTELEVGKAYQCILSGKKMLVVEAPKDDTDTKVLGGKYAINLDNGQMAFQIDEVCDGQLKELEK